MHSTKNMFTTYLVKAIKNTKINYVNKEKRAGERIGLFEPTQIERISYTENLDVEKACEAVSWDDESDNVIVVDWQQFVRDKRLVCLFKRLTRREQDIIWRRLIIKQGFEEIGNAYSLTEHQIMHIYYYAISKMRRYSDEI